MSEKLGIQGMVDLLVGIAADAILSDAADAEIEEAGITPGADRAVINAIRTVRPIWSTPLSLVHSRVEYLGGAGKLGLALGADSPSCVVDFYGESVRLANLLDAISLALTLMMTNPHRVELDRIAGFTADGEHLGFADAYPLAWRMFENLVLWQKQEPKVLADGTRIGVWERGAI